MKYAVQNIFQTLLLNNKRNLSISLIFACVLYIGLVLFSEPYKILDAFSKFSIFNWLLILGCSLSNYLLRFFRWHYYLSYLRHYIPIYQHFLYYMAGFALTLTPAKVGETIRSTYLAQHSVPYTQSFAMFFTERFLDLVIIALLSIFILQSQIANPHQNVNNFVIISIIVIVSFIPLLRQSFVTQFLDYLQRKTRWLKLQALLQHFKQLISTARDFFTLKAIAIGFIFGAIAWLIQGLAFYFILTTLNVDINLQQSIGIYAISLLAGAISFVPGGIGTTEAVMTLLLSFLGVDSSTAIAAALISRLSTLWFAFSLGFIAATILSFRKND